MKFYDIQGLEKTDLIDKNYFEMFGFGLETTETNVLKDCLNVKFDGTRNGRINGVCSLSGYETTSMPPNCTVGMRTEYVFNYTNTIVEVIEIKPEYGRRWANMFNGKSWIGWKQV